MDYLGVPQLSCKAAHRVALSESPRSLPSYGQSSLDGYRAYPSLLSLTQKRVGRFLFVLIQSCTTKLIQEQNSIHLGMFWNYIKDLNLKVSFY